MGYHEGSCCRSPSDVTCTSTAATPATDTRRALLPPPGARHHGDATWCHDYTAATTTAHTVHLPRRYQRLVRLHRSASQRPGGATQEPGGSTPQQTGGSTAQRAGGAAEWPGGASVAATHGVPFRLAAARPAGSDRPGPADGSTTADGSDAAGRRATDGAGSADSAHCSTGGATVASISRAASRSSATSRSSRCSAASDVVPARSSHSVRPARAGSSGATYGADTGSVVPDAAAATAATSTANTTSSSGATTAATRRPPPRTTPQHPFTHVATQLPYKDIQQ